MEYIRPLPMSAPGDFLPGIESPPCNTNCPRSRYRIAAWNEIAPHRLQRATVVRNAAVAYWPSNGQPGRLRQQLNLQDCGLFAAAFLFKWVTESVNTPLRINFTLSEMRPHLAMCLERELVEPFHVDVSSKRRKAGSAAGRQVVL